MHPNARMAPPKIAARAVAHPAMSAAAGAAGDDPFRLPPARRRIGSGPRPEELEASLGGALMGLCGLSTLMAVCGVAAGALLLG